MISVLIISLCCLTAGALYIPQQYSFSPSVGSGNGLSFASEGEGPITGLRVWERSGAYIRGFQMRYSYVWTAIYGQDLNEMHEFLLYDYEAIVQISGKTSPTSFIYELMFVTNRGRIFKVGHPAGTSFNFFPTQWRNELLMISGRADGNGITAIAAHWGPRIRIYPISPPAFPLTKSNSSTPSLV